MLRKSVWACTVKFRDFNAFIFGRRIHPAMKLQCKGASISELVTYNCAVSRFRKIWRDSYYVMHIKIHKVGTAYIMHIRIVLVCCKIACLIIKLYVQLRLFVADVPLNICSKHGRRYSSEAIQLHMMIWKWIALGGVTLSVCVASLPLEQ